MCLNAEEIVRLKVCVLGFLNAHILLYSHDHILVCSHDALMTMLECRGDWEIRDICTCMLKCSNTYMHVCFHDHHVRTCMWISNMWISMYVSMQSSNNLNVWASNHQSVQLYENDGIHVSVQVIVKACRHCIRSSKHMNIKECELRSMWSLKQVNMSAFYHQSKVKFK